MAFFASTTTSGYSDPLKAFSIKALEQRQKDLLAQTAAAQAGGITPENTQTPVQGFGHLANQLGDQFKQGRAEQAAAEGRNELAGIIAQGPKGADGNWAPEQLAVMARRSPDLMEKFYQQQHERRNLATTESGMNRRADNTNTTTMATNAATVGATTRGQDIQQGIATQSDQTARAGQQLQLDLADKAAKARRDESIAQREWESAEKRLAEVQANGTEQQKIEAQKARDAAQQKHELARDTANNAANLTDKREGRTAEAERQERQIKATSDLAEKQFGYSKESKTSDQNFTAAQAELDRALKTTDRQAQIAAAKALAEAGQTHEKSLATDKMAHEERLAQHKIEAANLAAKTTPDYIKATTEAKDTYANHLLSVEKLKEARALAPMINTGPWQSLVTGTTLATGGKIGDKASAEATTRFNSLMDEQAILAMSKTLKGQSTDFEMKEFKKVFNNPNAKPEDRLAALDRLIRSQEVELTNHREALKSFTGSGDSAARIETGMNAKPSNMTDDAIRSEAADRLKTAGPEEAAQINARLKAWRLQ